MEGNTVEWFSEWFNSPFYHILYKDRDFKEAETFIDALGEFLDFQKGQKALDAACGRGRHSIFLHEKGLTVDGIDLSEKNIEFAKQFEKKDLNFFVQDIREVFKENEYKYVFNLFTSFGYSEKEDDNFRIIHAFSKELIKEGYLIIDFLNPERIILGLIPEEQKVIEGITFNIKRTFCEGFIVKSISFQYQNKNYSFQEKVKALRMEDFLKYFNFSKLKIVNVFGDYTLNPYNEHYSERMIFITQK